MKLSFATVSLSAAVLVLSMVLVGTRAQDAKQAPAPAVQKKYDAPAKAARHDRFSGMMKAEIRPRDPHAAPWRLGPVPAAIPVDVTGVARDEAGNAIAGATITLYTAWDKGSKPVGTATTDAAGRYSIRAATVPVSTTFGGRPFPPEITPHATFILNGLAPGRAVAWSQHQTMYAVKEPHPDDIQGHLPLGSPVVLDLTFPRAAALQGKVVDQDGQPVEGAKLQVLDAVLLDDAGRETDNRQGYDWKALPASVGRAVTARDGGFRMEGLPERACFWISVNRPETDNTMLGFHAATIAGPDTIHPESPPAAFIGRGRHEVKTNPITIVFPKIRLIAVTVVGDDTGKPLASVRIFTLGDTLDTGIGSGGTTDAAGKVLLGLPPGEYKGISADPPFESRYVRTREAPLVVKPGEGAQPYEFHQKAGVEVIFRAVEAGTGNPVPDVYFWKTPEDKPEEAQLFQTSTFWVGWDDRTNAKGEMRAVLPPEPGKRCRFRFAGFVESNRPRGADEESANKKGYQAFPTQSAPIEMVGGATVQLRFILRKPYQP